jgi:hypothetical protein
LHQLLAIGGEVVKRAEEWAMMKGQTWIERIKAMNLDSPLHGNDRKESGDFTADARNSRESQIGSMISA